MGARGSLGTGKKKTGAGYKPNPVPPQRGHDHLSGMPVARHLLQPTRELRTGRPKPCRRHGAVPLFGLAPDGVCHAFHVTMKAVSSYLTISPLPRHAGAVYFLWHFPRGRPQFALRTIPPDGVRTFLSGQGRSDHAPAPVKLCENNNQACSNPTRYQAGYRAIDYRPDKNAADPHGANHYTAGAAHS